MKRRLAYFSKWPTENSDPAPPVAIAGGGF